MSYHKLATTLLLVSLGGGALVAQQTRAPENDYLRRRAAAMPPSHDDSGNPIVYDCNIEPVEDVNVPATDPGVLVHQAMKLGARVEAEDVIARIDAREAESEKRIALYERDAKIKQAKNDIEIRYSKKAAEHAKAELESVLAANEGVDRAVPEPEVNKARLEAQRSVLAIEKAERDQELARLDAWTSQAKVDAAEMKIERRTIRAPFDGVVLEVHRDQGEWVNPGDTIVRLVRLDTLNVDGMIELAHHSPADVKGCEVTVIATAGKGREVRATGRIVNVRPEVIGGHSISVRAEIANRNEDGQWLIFPRMKSRMIVHLGTGGVAVGSRQ